MSNPYDIEAMARLGRKTPRERELEAAREKLAVAEREREIELERATEYRTRWQDTQRALASLTEQSAGLVELWRERDRAPLGSGIPTVTECADELTATLARLGEERNTPK